MTALDDREKAFENKFAHDEEVKFRVLARRNRLAGLWAAGEIGLGDRDAYAAEMSALDLLVSADTPTVGKLLHDFTAHGIRMDEAQIRRRLAEFQAEAGRQVAAE